MFGNAVSAYQTHPGPDFAKLVGTLWKDLPQAQVEAAVDSIVAHVSAYSDEQNGLAVSYTTAHGIASLPTRQDTELFEIIAPLRAYEPDKLNRLLRDHADLAKALEVLPDGYDRKQIQGASMGARQKGGGAATDSAFLISSQIIAKVMKSLKYARSQWTPSRKAASIREPRRPRVGADYRRGLRSVEGDELAKEAFGRSRGTLEQMYRTDSDPNNPNIAPVDFWPSTAAYRSSFQSAAKLYGVSASSYFEKIRDRNELLESQVAFAAELLHRPPAPANTASNYAKPLKQVQ